jgi:hypothetical protein
VSKLLEIAKAIIQMHLLACSPARKIKDYYANFMDQHLPANRVIQEDKN